MSLLLLFNQTPSSPEPQPAGGWIVGYSRKELDRHFQEWRRRRNKHAPIIVKAALATLEISEGKGLLTALEPAIQLRTALSELPLAPTVAQLEQIKVTAAQLQAILDEDDDDILLLAMSLN